MLARHIPDIIIIFSLEQIMFNKCAAPFCQIWLCQERNKTYHKVSFSFEKFRTEQNVDLICQPQKNGSQQSSLFYVSFILKRSKSFEVESQV